MAASASSEVISSREVGQLPVSIGSSLGLESLLNIHPDIQHKTPPLTMGFQEVWINIRTLFRNLNGSLNREDAMSAMPNHIGDAILQEMETIAGIVNHETAERTRVVFYVSNYERMDKKYPRATLRVDSTPKQQIYTSTLHKAVQHVLDSLKGVKRQDYDVCTFPLKLRPTSKKKTLIMTHYAYDLLSYPEFGELVLLESHTGALKPRALWYTKYLNGKDLSMIPFREDFIQIFGDSEHFRPMAASLKKDLVELATASNWNQTTTTDRIRLCVDRLKNPWAKELVKSIIV
jgi:hypothetical protein